MPPLSRRALLSRTATCGVGVRLGLAVGGCAAPADEVVGFPTALVDGVICVAAPG